MAEEKPVNTTRKTLVVVFLAVCCNLVAAAEQSPTVALIPANGDRQPDRVVLDRLEAAWLQQKDIALVERQQLEKILAEQQITAAAMVDPRQRLRLGQLVPAELLVFVDGVPGLPQPATRIQVSESKTGIVLASEILENAALLANPQAALGLVRLANAKRVVPVKDRHLLGYLDFRSEESGPMLDGIAAALGTLVMTDLARAPQIIVLEREHLQHLQTEHDLTSMEQSLRTSVRLFEGGLRRVGNTNHLAVAISLRPLTEGKALVAALTIPANDAVASRTAIAAKMSELLQTKPPEQIPSDGSAEARMFARQAVMWTVWGDRARALRAAEAANALDPSRENELLLAQMLVRDHPSVDVAIRANHLLLDSCKSQLRAIVDGTETNLFLPTLSYQVRLGPGNAQPRSDSDLRRQLEDLEEDGFRCRLKHYARKYDSMGVAYWDTWLRQLEFLQAYHPGQPARQAALVREAIDAFVHPPARPERVPLERMEVLVELSRQMQPKWNQTRVEQTMMSTPLANLVQRAEWDFSAFPLFGPAGSKDLFFGLFREMTAHNDPFVRLVAHSALARLLLDSPATPDRQRAILEEQLACYRVVAEDLPPNHLYRRQRRENWNSPYANDFSVFSLLPRRLLSDSARSGEKPPDWATNKKLEYCYRILVALVDTKDAERLDTLENAANLHQMWLDELAANGRLVESCDLLDRIIPLTKDHTDFPRNTRGHAELVAQRERFDQRLHGASTPVAPAPATTPTNGPGWENWEIHEYRWGLPLLTERAPSNDIRPLSCFLRSDDNHLDCARIIGKNDTSRLELTAHRLADGSLIERQIVPLTSRLAPWGGVHALAFAPGALYLGTSAGLVTISLPGGEAKLIGPSEGLPGKTVRALGWYDGHLYLGIGCSPYSLSFQFVDQSETSVLAAYDPMAKTFAIIASEKTVADANPWDGTRFWLDEIVPEERHQCLWLIDRVRGLWKLTPATGSLTEVISGRGHGQVMRNGSVIVSRLSIFQPIILYDFQTQSALTLPFVTGRSFLHSVAVARDGNNVFLAVDERLFLIKAGKDPSLLTRTSAEKQLPGIVQLHESAAGVIAVAWNGEAFLIKPKAR